MRKYLTLALALAMAVSSAALTACGDDSATTTTKAKSDVTTTAPAGDTTGAADPTDPGVGTTPANPTEPAETTNTPDGPDTPPLGTFESQFHGYEPIDNLEAFKGQYTNLTAAYFDVVVMSQSIFNGHDWTDSEDENMANLGNQDAPNLFDCDPNTKWCCAKSDVEFAAAVVWQMTQSVNVTAYTLTTGDDNVEWPSRNPIQWRLYGCNELPEIKITDEDENEGDSYLHAGTVPEGWVLIDAVNAEDPDDIWLSQIPDENHKEIALNVANPGSYKYFMLLIDYTENDDVTFQLADFTLYGSES